MPRITRVPAKSDEEIRKEQSQAFHSGELDGILLRINVADKERVPEPIELERLALQTKLEQEGGVGQFWGLYNFKRQRIAAKLVPTKWGRVWGICSKPLSVKPLLTLGGACLLAGQPVVRETRFQYFVPFCKASLELHNRRVNDKKIHKRIGDWEDRHGFFQLRETAKARAVIAGHNMGQNGSLWVEVGRADEGYPEGSIYLPPRPLTYEQQLDDDIEKHFQQLFQEGD